MLVNLNSGLTALIKVGFKNSFISLSLFGWEIKISIELGNPNDVRNSARRN